MDSRNAEFSSCARVRAACSNRDGCPDLDDDADGVLQGADRCEGAAEDRDGHDDEDGCPDPDDDRDGVLDDADHCPDQAETIDGRDDADGCPDRGGRAAWRRTGSPGRADFALAGTIAFARDGAIAPASASAVDQLARHVVSAWGSRLRIAIGRGTEAQIASLRAALTERGVGAVDVVADAAARDVRVSVLPDPIEPAAVEVGATRTETTGDR
jgi:hypothetical protein